MTAPIPMKRRERDAVLQSLQAGLVPRQGLHLIQVGRKAEVSALLADLDRICDQGGAFRIVVGRFGSGKTFFLNLVRNLAFQKGIVVVQTDFSMERRLYATGGEARALYSALMYSMATKAQPDGGAFPSVLSSWISEVQQVAAPTDDATAQTEKRIAEDLRDLQNYVGGFDFAEVLRAYYRGYAEKNDVLQAAALKWLRGEYTAKTDARSELGVRRIVDDDSLYDSLKLVAAFVRKAGFRGLLVNLDEMVVLSHRLPSSRARQANYEALLTLLNDSFQGNCCSLGFIFAGTDECLEDKRRGLFSYEALRSRLAENPIARQQGLVDLSGPVIRLQPLTPEDLFVLLKNVAVVHANGDPEKVLVPDEGIKATLEIANQTLGADFFRTPRDVVRSFVGLLNILEQNPGKTWQEVLGSNVFEKSKTTVSAEEEIAKGVLPPAEADEDLTTFKV